MEDELLVVDDHAPVCSHLFALRIHIFHLQIHKYTNYFLPAPLGFRMKTLSLLEGCQF